MIHVASVEDDRRYRDSLALLFAHAPDFELSGAFGTPSGLLASLAAGATFDVVLMDLDLPGMDGVAATRRLRRDHPDLPVIVLTAFDDPPRILAAIRAGADGYLLKDATRGELLDAVRQVLDGGAPLTPGVARSVLDLVRAPESRAPAPDLSTRERQVLDALVRGLAYKQVASELEVSIDTVRTHVRGLYRKLQVHSATEAVSKALREGWVE
jgi:DNA-binding NarL/FixJ family response regulator